jgi:hypothetical protein
MQANPMNSQALQAILCEGLLSFPLTKLVGHDAGPVRTPLTDLLPNEMEELDALIKQLGAQ